MSLFSNDQVNLDALRQKAFNYRWATLAQDVIPLTAADPDFPVAGEITRAIADYCADGYFSYAPADGLPAFKQAIAAWYQRSYQVDANPHFILPVNSAAYGLFTAASMILSEGDNAIIPNPVDFLFRKAIENADATVRTVEIDPATAQFDLDQLSAAIDSNTKAIFICNPNNPLGIQPSPDHLRAILLLASKHDLWVVSDEIWSDIYFNRPTTSIASRQLPYYAKRLIVSGLSKNFALAGLRVGYVICPDEPTYRSLLQASKHLTTAYGMSSIAQVAGTAALTLCDDWLHAFRKHLSDMRQITLQFLEDMPFFETVAADATYLVFPKIIHSNLNAAELVEVIHQKARVALVPGGAAWFESASEGHLRICYSTSEKILTESFDRIRKIESLIMDEGAHGVRQQP
jgi:aspartate/methionine/tyrosine aminotransferase